MREIRCKYVILCRERTGSNYLVDMLAQHPEITAHNELFHETAIFSAEGDEHNTDVIRMRDDDPVVFLQNVLAGCGTVVCGFKHRNFYDGDAVTEFVLSSGFHVVTLERENILAQYSSMLVAAQTGQWTLKQGDQAVAGRKLEWDEDGFERYRRDYQAEYENLYQRVRESGVSWLALRYGELFSREMMRRVFEFLGVLGDVMTDERIRKQNTSRILERFSEPGIVGEYLRRIGKEKWAEEN